MKFRSELEIESGGGAQTLRLSGVIDEDCDLESLLKQVTSSAFRIELAEVERMNPMGTSAFDQFLRSLSSHGTAVTLVQCSPAVVAQLATLTTESVAVESIAIPYFCPECDEPRVLWADAAELESKRSAPPLHRCHRCDLVMQFDDDPATYFAFAGTSSKPVEPVSEPEKAPPVAAATVPGAVLVGLVLLAIAVAAFLLLRQ